MCGRTRLSSDVSEIRIAFGIPPEPREYATDSLGYTKAKTTFIQDLVDKARAKLGLPSVDVWPE